MNGKETPATYGLHPKGGVFVTKTAFWLMKVYFFQSSFAVKVSPLGLLQNVKCHFTTPP